MGRTQGYAGTWNWNVLAAWVVLAFHKPPDKWEVGQDFAVPSNRVAAVAECEVIFLVAGVAGQAKKCVLIIEEIVCETRHTHGGEHVHACMRVCAGGESTVRCGRYSVCDSVRVCCCACVRLYGMHRLYLCVVGVSWSNLPCAHTRLQARTCMHLAHCVPKTCSSMHPLVF